MYKVRFNLERGNYYGYWQVCLDNTFNYYHPSNTFLQMVNCTLHNKPNVAAKINGGAAKKVCSWIQCEELVAYDSLNATSPNKYSQIFYNPRVFPYWVDAAQNNIDNKNYSQILTVARRVYAKVS